MVAPKAAYLADSRAVHSVVQRADSTVVNSADLRAALKALPMAENLAVHLVDWMVDC